jgi:hypothetical protein
LNKTVGEPTVFNRSKYLADTGLKIQYSIGLGVVLICSVIFFNRKQIMQVVNRRKETL